MTLKRAYLIILGAFAWLLVWGTLAALVIDPRRPWLADIIMPTAIVGFLAGLLTGFGVWTRAKGWPVWLGVLLAWLGPLGMFIVVCLKDRSVRAVPESTWQLDEGPLFLSDLQDSQVIQPGSPV